tara:strand:- start:1129 stop:1638 length:510 start_codon:yes stop_codon:yes gene_type:complete
MKEKTPDTIYSHQEINDLRGYIVYGLFDKNNKALYVGMSTDGVARPISKSHEQLKEINPGDCLKIWKMPNYDYAVSFEKELIEEYKPCRNKTGVVPVKDRKKTEALCRGCGEEFTKKTQWQRFCSSKCRSRKWEKDNPRMKTKGMCPVCKETSFIVNDRYVCCGAIIAK